MLSENRAGRFFRDMAVPSVEEFRSMQYDRRLACLAAIMVVHVADHIVSADAEIPPNRIMNAAEAFMP
ncbi:hypothetical protein, partial [Teichococcus aestuarii]|uniref:hypothetical protein n=1 Tax=Teichococcus aestuarii TaxID=568898 RepID=UPI003614CDEF